jgi:hypothetical protein
MNGLNLELTPGQWVIFTDRNGHYTVLPAEDYNPDNWGHKPNGEYLECGAGGVYFTNYVQRQMGWCWKYIESDKDNPYSDPFKTKQEAFDDAWNELYASWEDKDRTGSLDDWYAYCNEHELSDHVIDVTVSADNSHFEGHTL